MRVVIGGAVSGDTQSETSETRRPAAGAGLALGLAGVVVFGLTLPATRLAVAHLDAWAVAFGRASLAGLLAAAVLALTRAPLPARTDWPSLAVTSLGVVLGFPLLATLAMRHAPAGHGGVVLGVLPLATAVASVIRAGERPSLLFWASAVAGSAAVVTYAFLAGGAAPELAVADLLLVGAVASAALGYAEGGLLARRLGGWQVISWALVLALPFMALATWTRAGAIDWQAPFAAWAGFLYVAVLSQYLGFFAWYRGLALGGIARVGQLQLLQTFVTLGAAAVLLGEAVGALELAFAAVVTATVATGWRSRVVHSYSRN